jgi:2-iminobutanoate/2-iminopropanoate deaminase
MRFIALLLPLFLSELFFGAEMRAIVPTPGPAIIGPYSPGISVGDYLYVSGQGAKAPDGSMPDTFAGQVRQTLENVKAVVEAAGLTMDHIVYMQVYLEDMQNFDQMNSVYAQYFQKAPPAGHPRGRETAGNTGRDQRRGGPGYRQQEAGRGRGL